MTIQVRHRPLMVDDSVMLGERVVKRTKTQPPRDCDQCGVPQSIYRNQHETRCWQCQRKTPPNDWAKMQARRKAYA